MIEKKLDEIVPVKTIADRRFVRSDSVDLISRVSPNKEEH